jgi:hypothetical protein
MMLDGSRLVSITRLEGRIVGIATVSVYIESFFPIVCATVCDRRLDDQRVSG